MGAALAIIITFSLSVLLVRIATVALQATGLTKDVAKFQALSAFSGAGYTTTETEQIVNFPVRRKIIAKLIVIGNLGAVAILSTLVVGFVKTESDPRSILIQLSWFVLALVLVWFFLLSKKAEEITRRIVRHFLLSRTELGQIPFTNVLQIGEEWSIAEHKITHNSIKEKAITFASLQDCLPAAQVIAVKCQHGTHTVPPDSDHVFISGESLVVLAPILTHQDLAKHLLHIGSNKSGNGTL